MDHEPAALRAARLLVDRVAAGGCDPEELHEVRTRLACLVAHPSCYPELADRARAAILVLDLVGMAVTPDVQPLAS
jgi:hypothetical protein